MVSSWELVRIVLLLTDCTEPGHTSSDHYENVCKEPNTVLNSRQAPWLHGLITNTSQNYPEPSPSSTMATLRSKVCILYFFTIHLKIPKPPQN